MTDNEIIKELQEEIHLVEYVDGGYSEHASLEMLKGCLDLIKRQKAEIEKLQTEIAILKNEKAGVIPSAIGDLIRTIKGIKE